MVSLEVCANSVASAIAAQAGGAIRVELCDNLNQGGTTPSHGQITIARSALHIKLYTLIRPRAGDFEYSKQEFDIMLSDVRHAIERGCDGIVTGILNRDGSVDIDRCSQIVNMARQHGLGVTFHRAFDMCADHEKALEDVISCGFERILTSGGKTTSIEGAAVIRHLITQANGRIIIMPGGGISEANVADLISFTGAEEIHASLRTQVRSLMEYQNDHILMGADHFNDEYVHDATDEERVRKLLSIVNPIDPEL